MQSSPTHWPGSSLVRGAPDVERALVGSGSYSTVYKAIDNSTGNAFAIKVMEMDKYRDGPGACNFAHRQLDVFQRLEHVSGPPTQLPLCFLADNGVRKT